MNRLLIAVLLSLVACASLQVVTPGSVAIPGANHDQAYTSALRAVGEAGLVLKSGDRTTGYIYATRGAGLTASAKEVSLSVTVTADEQGATIGVRAILQGQMVAYGATTSLVERYCEALKQIEPHATMLVDGKPYPGG